MQKKDASEEEEEGEGEEEEEEEEEVGTVDGNASTEGLSLTEIDAGLEGKTSEDDDEAAASSPLSQALPRNSHPLPAIRHDGAAQLDTVNPIVHKDIRFPSTSAFVSSNSLAHEPVVEIRVPARDPPAEPVRNANNLSRRPPLRHSFLRDMNSGRKFKAIEAGFRVAESVFCLLAFCVMASNRQTGTELGTRIPLDAKFSNFQAYSYLLAMNVLGFVYSSAQLIMLKVNSKQRFSLSPLGWAIGTFFCDQVLAFLLFSASTSAATVSILSRIGVGSIWPSICTVWQVKNFCIQAESSTGLSFLASFCAIVVALLSGDRLFRNFISQSHTWTTWTLFMHMLQC